MDIRRTLLKLALSAAERGDATSAADALRAALALPDVERGELVSPSIRAVTRTAFAKIISATPEHVSHLIRRGRIPASAILGEGRGLRIVVDAALAAMRGHPDVGTTADDEDPLVAEGAAYARERCSRVKRGAGG